MALEGLDSCPDLLNPAVHVFRTVRLHVEGPGAGYYFKQVVPHQQITRLDQTLVGLENILEEYGTKWFSVLLTLEVADGKVIQRKEAPLPALAHVPLLHTVAAFDEGRPGGTSAAGRGDVTLRPPKDGVGAGLTHFLPIPAVLVDGRVYHHPSDDLCLVGHLWLLL